MALIAAFARPARLYLLDEPSAGLDPVTDSLFRRQVQRASNNGAAVLLSSHILSEVEQLCDRVTIIRSGRAVESGTLAELRKLIHFRIEGAGAGLVASIPWAQGVVQNGDVAGIRGLNVSPPSLESLFLSHYRSPMGPVL